MSSPALPHFPHRPQPLFLRSQANVTSPILGAVTDDLFGTLSSGSGSLCSHLRRAGLARLRCGARTYTSVAGSLGDKLVSLGATSIHAERLVPLSPTEGPATILGGSESVHAAANQLSWLFLLEWTSQAGHDQTVPVSLIHKCALSLQSATASGATLTNRAGEAVQPVDRQLASNPLERGCQESTVFDLTRLDSPFDGDRCHVEEVDGEPVALLEVDTVAQMIPGLSLILDPVINEAMEPIVNTFTETVSPAIMETAAEQLQRELVLQVPGDLAAMLTATVTANATNMAVDAITGTATEHLTNLVGLELGGYLTDKSAGRWPLLQRRHPIMTTAPAVSEALEKACKSIIADALSETLPEKVSKGAGGATPGPPYD